MVTGKPRKRADGRSDIVLLGKHRGGNQNRRTCLPSIMAFHGGTEGNLGLTKAYIAAEQPIHGRGGLHIRLDLLNTAKLVIGFRHRGSCLQIPPARGQSGEKA